MEPRYLQTVQEKTLLVIEDAEKQPGRGEKEGRGARGRRRKIKGRADAGTLGREHVISTGKISKDRDRTKHPEEEEGK